MLVHRESTACFAVKSQKSCKFLLCFLSLFSVFYWVVVIFFFSNFISLIFFLVRRRFALHSRWMEICGLNSSHCWNKTCLTRVSGLCGFNSRVVVFLRRNSYCSFAIILIFVPIGSLLGYFSFRRQESIGKDHLIWGKNPYLLLIWYVIYKTSFVKQAERTQKWT